MNSRERVIYAMVWAGPTLEVALCTLGAGARLQAGVVCYGGRVILGMGRVQVGVS